MSQDPATPAAVSWMSDASGHGPASARAAGPTDARAYQQFCSALRDCEGDLLKRALGFTRNLADARDLTQRALERGLRSLHRFESGTNVRSWLLRILTNLFIDDCRRAASGPRLEPLDERTAGGEAPEPEEDEPEPPWSRITPEQFHDAMCSLPLLFRQIYELRIRDGLRYADIAARLDIPLGTVATRLARARKRLHHLLAPLAAAAEDEGST
jgi:RNA polymerase sigma-70 factor, ECF subfamily